VYQYSFPLVTLAYSLASASSEFAHANLWAPTSAFASVRANIPSRCAACSPLLPPIWHSMNIKEVAKLAKVSTATVSRTINGSDKVSARTAERVQKAIKELNFYPNTHARTLVSGRSRMLGLIISDITNPFFPELVKHFEDQAVQKGLEVIIANTDYKPKRMVECIRRMVERKVDGAAIMTSEADPAMVADLTRRNIPTVFMDTGKNTEHSANILIDYSQGIQEALQHLFSLNHRRIAFISGPLNLPSARRRLDAFVAGMTARGFAAPEEYLEKGDHRMEGGIAAMRNLLRLPERPTAVITSNDLTAIGALGVIHDSGLQVPRDISLVGYDDISFARLTQPPLTTIILSRSQLAFTAFAALEKLIRKEKLDPADYSMTTHLILRESTRTL
jgi:DNA-binding LacI/PurR family transcriptional regulator